MIQAGAVQGFSYPSFVMLLTACSALQTRYTPFLVRGVYISSHLLSCMNFIRRQWLGFGGITQTDRFTVFRCLLQP